MYRPLTALLFVLAIAACSTTSSTDPVPSVEPASAGDDEQDAAPPPVADAGKGDAAHDAAAEAAPAPAYYDGKEGKSCGDACAAIGKTCTVACVTHRSCGADDDKSPPYAGYACYYYETKDPSGSFRNNDGRALMTCDEVATLTWEHFGNVDQIGDYLGANPVSCCCK